MDSVQSAVFKEQKDYNLSLTRVFVEGKQIIRDVDWSTKAFLFLHCGPSFERGGMITSFAPALLSDPTQIEKSVR